MIGGNADRLPGLSKEQTSKLRESIKSKGIEDQKTQVQFYKDFREFVNKQEQVQDVEVDKPTSKALRVENSIKEKAKQAFKQQTGKSMSEEELEEAMSSMSQAQRQRLMWEKVERPSYEKTSSNQLKKNLWLASTGILAGGGLNIARRLKKSNGLVAVDPLNPTKAIVSSKEYTKFTDDVANILNFSVRQGDKANPRTKKLLDDTIESFSILSKEYWWDKNVTFEAVANKAMNLGDVLKTTKDDMLSTIAWFGTTQGAKGYSDEAAQTITDSIKTLEQVYKKEPKWNQWALEVIANFNKKASQNNLTALDLEQMKRMLSDQAFTKDGASKASIAPQAAENLRTSLQEFIEKQADNTKNIDNIDDLNKMIHQVNDMLGTTIDDIGKGTSLRQINKHIRGMYTAAQQLYDQGLKATGGDIPQGVLRKTGQKLREFGTFQLDKLFLWDPGNVPKQVQNKLWKVLEKFNKHKTARDEVKNTKSMLENIWTTAKTYLDNGRSMALSAKDSVGKTLWKLKDEWPKVLKTKLDEMGDVAKSGKFSIDPWMILDLGMLWGQWEGADPLAKKIGDITGKIREAYTMSGLGALEWMIFGSVPVRIESPDGISEVIETYPEQEKTLQAVDDTDWSDDFKQQVKQEFIDTYAQQEGNILR